MLRQDGSQDTRQNMMCRSKAQETEEKTGLEMALGGAQLARRGGQPGFKSPHCFTGKVAFVCEEARGQDPLRVTVA